MKDAASWRDLLTLIFLGLIPCLYGSIFDESGGLREILQEVIANKTWVNSLQEEQLIQESRIRKLGAFPCPALALSTFVPTSVHQLRPSDIKVVAAIGDSYTTGRAAGGMTPFNMLLDYRGNSWSIGGDQDIDFHTTMPNVLREFSPDLYGFSRGVGDRRANLNEAEIGDRSVNFVAQANNLVNDLKEDPDVDFQTDWKVITVFLGGNDLCEYCHDNITPEVYTSNMRAGLDILFENIPRAFVNLVQVMNAGLTQTLVKGVISNIVLRSECSCATFPESEEANERLAEYTEAYQQAVLDLADSGDYDNDNFTVVAQTFYRNITLPYEDGSDEVDYSFLPSIVSTFLREVTLLPAALSGPTCLNPWEARLQKFFGTTLLLYANSGVSIPLHKTE